MVTLDQETIQKLSWKGVLAYVAVSIKNYGGCTTAHLATLVGCRTEQMREGLEELSTLKPKTVVKAAKGKWAINIGDGLGLVQTVEVEENSERRKMFIDDLKMIWDWANPKIAFTMSAADGNAIRMFLRQHKDWDQATWRQALRHRYKSEVIVAQAPYRWLAKLGEYLECPLDKYGHPMRNGGGELGKAVDREDANRVARETFLANRV